MTLTIKQQHAGRIMNKNLESIFNFIFNNSLTYLTKPRRTTAVRIDQETNMTLLRTAILIGALAFVTSCGSSKKKEEAAPAPAPEPTAQEKLLAEIRDLLKK